MTEKLLPCPFCGGTNFKIDHELGVTISHTCENRVNYPHISVNAQTEDSARSGWNRRAAQPAESAEPDCGHCGGFGSITGDDPDTECDVCNGTGKAAPVAAQPSEPVAFSYELATTRSGDGEYIRWSPRLSYSMPNVPDGSIRNLQWLYAAPQPTESVRGEASMRVGAWLSAALEDPKVCDEMKADIRAWMDEGSPPAAPAEPVKLKSDDERAAQGLPPYNPRLPTDEEMKRLTENGRKAWGKGDTEPARVPSDSQRWQKARTLPRSWWKNAFNRIAAGDVTLDELIDAEMRRKLP